MKSVKHSHMYKRINIGRRKPYWVLACMLPECRHYVAEEMAKAGLSSLCHVCYIPFTLPTAKNERTVKPICPSCRGSASSA